jgi:hypothetical protein
MFLMNLYKSEAKKHEHLHPLNEQDISGSYVFAGIESVLGFAAQ